MHFYSEYVPNANNIKFLTIGYFRHLTTADVNTHYQSVQNSGVNNSYYYIDDVSLTPLPPLVTVNSPSSSCDPVNLTVDGIGAGNYLWSTGATTSSITVSPTITTTYTVTVTDYYNCNPVILQSIVTVPPTVEPIIKGYENNCDATVLYSIDNFDANYTYTWSTQVFNQTTNQYTAGQFIINGSTNVETANTASIGWSSATFPGLPNYVVITVEAHSKEGNCSTISTMKVYPCCEGDVGDGLIWHDQTITTAHNLTGTNISINGTVVLKNSLIMNGGAILFGPQAKIILETGGYFEITNGNLQNGCDYMWDGIYTNSNNEAIKIDNSTVGNSINGIVSTNGGTLLLDLVRFENNLNGVQLLNHKSVSFPFPPPVFTPANISITNCRFNNQNTANINLTLYPYMTKQSITGINISNMEDVQIGDDVLGGNEFYKMQNGIKIYNSKVNIYSNQFNGIENFIGPAPVAEAAISIQSKDMNDMDNIGDVTIGNSVNASNTFDACEKSIYSNNSKLLVKNNVFEYGHQSIDVYNFKNGTNIENNRFKDINFGIRINNLLGVNRKLDIYNNFFEGQADNSYSPVSREAINLINCNSQVNSSIRTKVANNTIRFAGQKYSITSGIRLQNCDGILVNSNHIARTTGISIINADWDKTIGIRVATSQGAQITDNYIWGFGQSITTYGNLTGTQFSCNELRIYKYGFYWSLYTSLSNQGRPGGLIRIGLNNHNYWASIPSINGNEKLAQGASADNIQNTTPFSWYHFSNMGSQYIPNSVTDFSANLKIQPIANDNAIHQCAGGSGPNGSGTSTGGGTPSGGSSTVMSLIENIEDPELRDFMFEDLLQGEEYIDLQNEYRAYDADFLYKMLADDTTMMWLGGEKDADYKYFFDSIQQANIGQFTKVYSLIEDGNFEKAIALNNTIVPEQSIFANLKTVLGIYMTTWCVERYDLSTTEYNTLFAIANQTPYEGGDAVYTARIMIGFEPDESDGVAYRLQHQDKVKEEEELFLYPNPASDNVTIEFTNEAFEEVSASLNVYTITGSLIYTKQFTTNNSFEVVSVKDLKNGVYIYHISLSNGMNKSGKLVILKQ